MLSPPKRYVLVPINDVNRLNPGDQGRGGRRRDRIFQYGDTSIIREDYKIIGTRPSNVAPQAVHICISYNAGFTAPDNLKPLAKFSKGILNRPGYGSRSYLYSE